MIVTATELRIIADIVDALNNLASESVYFGEGDIELQDESGEIVGRLYKADGEQWYYVEPLDV